MKTKQYGIDRTMLDTLLSDEALRILSETDPIEILEIETEEGPMYRISGCISSGSDLWDPMHLEEVLLDLGGEF